MVNAVIDHWIALFICYCSLVAGSIMFVLNSPTHGYKLFEWILDVCAYFIGLVFPFLIKCFLELLSCSLPILNISLHCYVCVRWTHVQHVLIINFVLYIAVVSATSTTYTFIHLISRISYEQFHLHACPPW